MSQYSEEDIKAKFIDPALKQAGWDESRIRREVTFTAGQIIVRGRTISRGKKKRADYILYYKNHLPIALIEAKDDSHSIADGMQQGLDYADDLDIPFVFSSNGDGFLFHNKLSTDGEMESEISMDSLPSPDELFSIYTDKKEVGEDGKELILQENFQDTSDKSPRYYQQVAINKVMQAVSKGQDRILLVMATGTGKTYTAFQIIWRLWKTCNKKRILFLVDRTALARQTMQGDFRHLSDVMTKVDGPKVDPSYEVYVALYQGLMSGEEKEKFKQFSADFFDLIIIDECHRGSAREDSQWREILDYYNSATQIGLTATPKETNDVSNQEYFGDPIYTYSLKRGIEDGYLAPYKVVRYILDKDIEWRPDESVVDEEGVALPDDIYNATDYDRRIIIDARTKAVAKKIAEFLKETDPYQKTIIFCHDINHAERMRQALTNELSEYVKENGKYIVRITGDNKVGKNEIENFINPEEKYPVIATTSQLLSTGVDTKTAKLIVLDKSINSMTEFKQIIGRGTRVEEAYGKYYFTIMDFRGVTRHFADPDFDGNPVQVYEKKVDEDLDIKEDIDEETLSSEEVLEQDPQEDILIDGTEDEQKPKKIRVRDGVEFYPVHKTIQYIDSETGKLVTENILDFTKKTILKDYASLDEFLSYWRESERKDVIVNELTEKGVLFDELRDEVRKDLDVFDLVLHVAYGKKPLTRSERVKNAHQNDYFAKYEGKAREIINLLLEKYNDEGITAIDDIGDLVVSPFSNYGTPVEIVEEIFGGRDNYMEVVKEIETSLYSQ